MPRLKRRRKSRASDFEKSLLRFLQHPTQTLWFFGTRAHGVKRRGEQSAGVCDKEHPSGGFTAVLVRRGEDPTQVLREFREKESEGNATE